MPEERTSSKVQLWNRALSRIGETDFIDSTTDPRPAAAQEQELCAKHQLPVAECFSCDPTLREPGRLWCTEHDRYEDRCFICHPELVDTGRLWCNEHSLYEDECFFCHPELREVETGSAEGDACCPGRYTVPLQWR